MDNSYLFLAIVLSIAVSGAVFYFLVAKMLDEQKDYLKIGARIETKKLTQPLRIQAFERCIVLLERIRPQALVMRIYKGGMNAKFTQAEFVRSIREEFNHNMGQQLYISDNSWKLIVLAREEVIQVMQVCGQEMTDDSDGGEYCKKLMMIFHQLEKSPIDEAIRYIKREMNARF